MLPSRPIRARNATRPLREGGTGVSMFSIRSRSDESGRDQGEGDQPLSLQLPVKGQVAALSEQLLEHSPETAPGAALSEQLVPHSALSLQLVEQAPLVAPVAASPPPHLPQQSPLVAPGAASWLWVVLQPARAKAAARVAAVKRVFIEVAPWIWKETIVSCPDRHDAPESGRGFVC